MTLRERERIRQLAQQQMEIAHSPKNLERADLWLRHNMRTAERPVIHIELGTFEQEMIDPLLECQDPVARGWERALYRNFFNLSQFDDDWVVPPYFPVGWHTYFRLFGQTITQTTAEDSVGHQFNYVINDLEEDWDTLGPSEFGVDETATMERKAQAEELFGDILPVEMTMGSLGAVPTQWVVHRMGMEAMFFSIYDYPELFKKFMDRIADDVLAYYAFLEEGGYLLPTNRYQGLGQGSRCFTDELPGEVSTTKDVWGYMDSQESVSISPEMFGEFIFPCYEKISKAYGLLSYGCCEPVDGLWEYIGSLSNLRKVSISPWCDEQKMADNLRGTDIIYHRKPSPNFLGVGETLDEDGFREHIRTTIQTAQGCTLEIAQRDVYTVANDLSKVQRYVEIIREEISNHWRP